ncbi:hypothetical protein [Halorubellus litoreus]|uniref:Uncharacterized protein n=1 Tax=Halorubellus litoreus TaxID=755308 RepID=A0ABD5VIG9_9EURY
MQEIGTWNASIDDESYNTDEVFDTVRARNVTAVHVEGDGVIQIEGEGTAQEYIKRIPGDYYQPPEWVTRDAEVLWLVRFTLADEGYAEGEIEVW